MKKVINATGIAILSLFPAFALAIDDVVIRDPKPGADSLKEIIGLVTDWIVLLVGGIAVLFIIWAGIQYVTSSGNKDRAEQAKQTLTYAVLGLIVIVLAKVILSLAVGLPTSLGITR